MLKISQPPLGPHEPRMVLRIWFPTYGQLGAPTIPAFPYPPQPAHVHPAWSDTVGSFSPHTLGQSSTAAVSGGHCGWTTRPWLQQKVHVELSPTRNNLVISYTFIFVTSRGHVHWNIRIIEQVTTPTNSQNIFWGLPVSLLVSCVTYVGHPYGQASRLGRSSVEAADPINLAKL